MPPAPEHYRPVVPWLPLSAILGFTFLGVSGTALLTYSTFSFAEASPSKVPAQRARVYDARAVAFDSVPESPAERAASISRALTATQTEVQRAEIVESERHSDLSRAVLLADADRQLRGFNGFTAFAGANNYLTVTGTTFGIAAQSTPSGFAAADAETLSMAPVPEASTWMCGAALFVLVAARGMRAHWHRKRGRD
jgi:hypothetical protein